MDRIKNDGLYSAILLKFSGNGKFPLKVRATSKNGAQTQLDVGGLHFNFNRRKSGR